MSESGRQEIPTLPMTGIKLLDERLSVFDSEGNPKFAVPSQELLTALNDSDSRIEYFGYVPNLQINLDQYWFGHNVGLPLSKQVLRDFPDQEKLRARGIACSLNGSLVSGNTSVKDIREIVNTGNEQEDRVYVTTGIIKREKDGNPFIMYDWTDYLFLGANRIRNRLPKDLAQNVFPALLVYDNSSVSKLISYQNLPQIEKPSLILKAYVLPYLR